MWLAPGKPWNVKRENHVQASFIFEPGTQFTCITSTKVQIRTPEELRAASAPAGSLRALLAQKYKY